MGLQIAPDLSTATPLPDVEDLLAEYSYSVSLVRVHRGIHEALLYNSLWYFAKHVLGMLVAPHHVEWSEMQSQKSRLNVIAARDHGKSAFWSYAYPIWQAWRNPGSLGYILSSTSDTAVELLEILAYGNKGLSGLLNNPKLAHLVDEQRVAKRQIRLNNGSVIRARGFGTRLRGGHPDWIVCDDVLDERSMYSPLQRQKISTYFFSAISNMVLKEGQIIVVGTPFHDDDLYGELRTRRAYLCRSFPGLYEDPSAPPAPDGSGKRYRALWHERYSVQDLLVDKKEEIGTVNFTREILCVPISDELSLFPASLFVDEVYATHIPWNLALEEVEAAGWTIYQGIDLAISISEKAAYFVIVTVAQDDKGNKYVLDLVRLHGASYKEQKAAAVGAAIKWQPEAIYVEDNAYQAVFGSELIEDTDLPFKLFHTGENKRDFMKGVPGIRRLLENKKIRFARGDRAAMDATDIIIGELQCFGFVDGKLVGVGSASDTVMALWFSLVAAREGASFRMSFAPRAREVEDEQNAAMAAVAAHTAALLAEEGDVDDRNGLL